MNKLTYLFVLTSCCLSQNLHSAIGSEADLMRAKAAAAIAIHNATANGNEAAPLIAVSPKVTVRPVVTMYSATWCAPCQRAKVELQEAKLPFDLRIADVSQGGQPDWCESIPAFAWVVKGQTRYVLGFPGVPHLVGSWQATQ